MEDPKYLLKVTFGSTLNLIILEPKKLKEASIRFQQTFSYPATERLVNYFSCTHGNRPGQVKIIRKTDFYRNTDIFTGKSHVHFLDLFIHKPLIILFLYLGC